jgi:hypothetical protein
MERVNWLQEAKVFCSWRVRLARGGGFPISSHFIFITGCSHSGWTAARKVWRSWGQTEPPAAPGTSALLSGGGSRSHPSHRLGKRIAGGATIH